MAKHGYELVDLVEVSSDLYEYTEFCGIIKYGSYKIYFCEKNYLPSDSDIATFILASIQSTIEFFNESNFNRNSLFKFIELQVLAKMCYEFGKNIFHDHVRVKNLIRDMQKRQVRADLFLQDFDDIDLSLIYNPND